VVGRNFLIIPFTTELQRASHWAHKNAVLLVLINGMTLLNDDDMQLNLSESSFDYGGFHEAMWAYRQSGMLNEGRLIIRIVDVPNQKKGDKGSPWRASTLLRTYLKNQESQWAKEGVEVEEYCRNPKDPEKWNSLVEKLKEPPAEEAIQSESGVGDVLVKAYPIRTPLSQYLYGQ
jgi:hypothetical protein